MSDEVKTNIETQASTPTGTQGSAPEVTPEVKTETPQAIKKRLKANGREIEVDEEELVRLASLGLGSHEKFQEAAKIRKEHAEMMEKIEKDPFSFLKSKDPAFRQKAEEYLYEMIQQDEMSPEAKKAKELEEQVKQYKEKEEQEKQAREQAEAKAIEEKYAKEYEQQLIQALESSSMPRDPYVVGKIVKVMSDALEGDIELTFEEAASLVKQNTMSEIQHFLSKLDDPTGFLGDDIMSKIRKLDLEKIKKSGKTATVETSDTPQQKNEKKYRGVDDLKAAIEQEFAKGS